MEKLKPKHDHKLTDIIKVAIFGLMLLLPFISWMPNAFYYGFNEHAVVGQEEQYYNFYQGVKNGKPNPNMEDIEVTDGTYSFEQTYIHYKGEPYSAINVLYNCDLPLLDNELNYIYYSFDFYNHFDNEPSNLNGNELDIYTYYENVLSEVGITEDNYNDIGLFNGIFEYQNTNQYNIKLNSIMLYMDVGDIETSFDFNYVQLFNLTSIFGSGNEPTKEQFENMLTQEYYNYGNNYVLKDRGTNITWSMYNSWEDVWQTPLFSWTNNSILKTGLNAFCSAFGIIDNSYITNLLVYELVIVAIYIVLDIVLTLFKWLTHIGQKE